MTDAEKELREYLFGKLKSERFARAMGRDFRKRLPPMKACLHCAAIQHTSQRICPECGHEHYEKNHRPSPFKGKTNASRERKDDPRYKK